MLREHENENDLPMDGKRYVSNLKSNTSELLRFSFFSFYFIVRSNEQSCWNRITTITNEVISMWWEVMDSVYDEL